MFILKYTSKYKKHSKGNFEKVLLKEFKWFCSNIVKWWCLSLILPVVNILDDNEWTFKMNG